MAFKDKVQSLLQKIKPQQEELGMRSNLATGGFSGYNPKVNGRKTSETAQFSGRQPVSGMAHMVPNGVNPDILSNMQDVGGQTGHVQQNGQMGGAPQQMYTQQPPQGMNYPPQPNWNAVPQQNTAYQQPQMNQTGWQPVRGPQQPPQQQPAPQPQPAQPQQNGQANNVYYFPQSVVDAQGNAFRMTLRVAQITGVNSCYGLIEFMQNREAIIVNAEHITDQAEADRCMDMLFGAAYAMQQRFSRISGKQIYLITPRDLQVLPYESISRLGREDMMRHWPGALEAEQQRSMQGRVDDFAGGMARRAPMSSTPAGMYTDFGGFGNHG